MTNETPTQEQATTEAPAQTISDSTPYAEYERLRRGGASLEKQADSAPEAKAPARQKAASESEPEENEANESDLDDDADEQEADQAEGKSEESEKERPRKKSGFQRRIDKLNARASAAQQQMEYWKAQALKDRAGETPRTDKVESTKADASIGKPNPDDFETHAEYVEAVTDWKINEREQKAKQEQERSKVVSDQERIYKAHLDRVEAFAKATPDFKDVLADVDDINVSPALTELIVGSENSPELIYELAKNREEFERINKLGPIKAAREFGKFEEKLAARASDEKKSPETKTVTSAPKPISTVGTAGKVTIKQSIHDDDIPFKDFERLRRAQLKRRNA